ncbi:TPA: hypothetical protein ACPO75_001826, partial [Haemophilus influenzae]
KTITLSCSVLTKGIKAGSGIRHFRAGAEVQLFYADGTNGWLSAYCNDVADFNGRISKTLTLSKPLSKLTYNKVQVRNIAEGEYKVDGIKLEVGNVATDWTPAPEDLDQSELINAKFVDIRQVVTSETEARTVWQNNAISRINGVESNIANIQRSVTTATQSISEVNQHLNAKIDGISVGGRNLLLGTAIGLSGNGAKNYQNKTYNVTSNIDVST